MEGTVSTAADDARWRCPNQLLLSQHPGRRPVVSLAAHLDRLLARASPAVEPLHPFENASSCRPRLLCVFPETPISICTACNAVAPTRYLITAKHENTRTCHVKRGGLRSPRNSRSTAERGYQRRKPPTAASSIPAHFGRAGPFSASQWWDFPTVVCMHLRRLGCEEDCAPLTARAYILTPLTSSLGPILPYNGHLAPFPAL